MNNSMFGPESDSPSEYFQNEVDDIIDRAAAVPENKDGEHLFNMALRFANAIIEEDIDMARVRVMAEELRNESKKVLPRIKN